jgi:hypothetical protein
MRRSAIVLSLLLSMFANVCAAQEEPRADSPGTTPTETPAAGSDAADNSQAAATKAPDLRVTGLSLPPEETDTPEKREEEEARQNRRTASLGDLIVLKTVPDLLGVYLDYAVAQNKTVTLFLDGKDTGIAAQAIDRENGNLTYHLERTGDNKRVWAGLLRDPFDNSERQVKASVGLSGGVAVPADKSTFTLVVVKWAWYAYFWLALIVSLLVLFGWLALKRDILRDGPKPCPYSLGRCQMAWWFFLILIGYVLIWLISGDQDTITESLLALMGISAGTALGAVLIDSTGGDKDMSEAASERLAYQAERENREKEEAAAQAAATAAPADLLVQKQLADAQAALAIVDAKLLAANNRLSGIAKPPQTRGLFRDILSDSNGTVGLHRFQIFVWTIVLGIILLVSVVTELSMPVFSATLLTTMGISAGTYLGFKFPEK